MAYGELWLHVTLVSVLNVCWTSSNQKQRSLIFDSCQPPAIQIHSFCGFLWLTSSLLRGWLETTYSMQANHPPSIHWLQIRWADVYYDLDMKCPTWAHMFEPPIVYNLWYCFEGLWTLWAMETCWASRSKPWRLYLPMVLVHILCLLSALTTWLPSSSLQPPQSKAIPTQTSCFPHHDELYPLNCELK